MGVGCFNYVSIYYRNILKPKSQHALGNYTSNTLLRPRELARFLFVPAHHPLRIVDFWRNVGS